MSAIEEMLARDAGELDADELRRYARHLVLPEVGIAGQERLKKARVLLVGAGGLGSPLALYLTAAGVGTLGVVEFDAVDESNLQRQVLYGQSDLGRPKLEAAAERLAEINPHVALEPHPERLDADNALELVSAYDIVADGSDNFPTRYLVNDACVKAGRPDVYGSIFRFEGQLSVFWAERGPCYRCLFPEPPPPGAVPSCAEGGVLGILPGIVGSLQANEVVKLILGVGEAMIGRLMLIDTLAFRFRELALKKSPTCPACAGAAEDVELVAHDDSCAPAGSSGQPAGEPAGAREAAAPAPPRRAGGVPAIEVRELAALRDAGAAPALLDVRNPDEWHHCRIEGAGLIPLHELPLRHDELDPAADTVVYCHTGIRSAEAVRFLASRGFDRVRNLTGGIEAWSLEVDPDVPRY